MSLDEFTIHYVSEIINENIAHDLTIEKINSGANTEALIAMINEDRFIEEKQHLVSVLPLVKAVELPGGGREIICDNCGAAEHSLEDEIELEIFEPAWSICAGCAVK